MIFLKVAAIEHIKSYKEAPRGSIPVCPEKTGKSKEKIIAMDKFVLEASYYGLSATSSRQSKSL